MALFSVVAVVLAAAGLFAVISYGVARRTHEIGIRVALGATRTDIFRLVMSRGLALAACGVVIGLASAVAVSRTLTPPASSGRRRPARRSRSRLLAADSPP